MFESLIERSPDAIIALMEMAKADPNPDKIDLGVGVYKASDGSTPIMRAVKDAEKLYLSEEETKSYVSTAGNPEFRRLMTALTLGSDHPAVRDNRVASAQGVGGSGALRLCAELLKSANPQTKIWVSTPTWANHEPLIGSVGLQLAKYPYYNKDTMGVDFEDMLSHLDENAKPGDVILLHGCCHNPTGADLSPDEWDRVAAFMAERKLIPFIDVAYAGLGAGLEEDMYGTLKVIETCGEVLIALSCSKNFALYKERVGMAMIIARDAERARIVQSELGLIQRKLVSMPPDHGAALVARILGDEALRKVWHDELVEMQGRIVRLRETLSEALNVQGGEIMARAVREQKGMFSMLPLTLSQVERLRNEHSIYMTNSARINIAGSTVKSIPRLADAILKVL